METTFYQEFIENFKNYANTNENIRTAIIMGSRARKDPPADAYSDLDIFIYWQDPSVLLNDETWLHSFGKVIRSFVYQTTASDPERLTIFDDCYQVDTVCFSLEKLKILLTKELLLQRRYI
jgi:aminoglycoside 6-adenylyltransferase